MFVCVCVCFDWTHHTKCKCIIIIHLVKLLNKIPELVMNLTFDTLCSQTKINIFLAAQPEIILSKQRHLLHTTGSQKMSQIQLLCTHNWDGRLMELN
jgi:hypothetical protein